MTSHRTLPHPARSYKGSIPRFAAGLAAVILVLSLGAGIGFGSTAQAQAGLASLDGTVTDLTGAPLEDAQVVLKKQAQGSLWHYHQATTDGAGYYAFSDLEGGTWNLSVQKDGYQTHHEEIEIDLNGSESQDVMLRSINEAELSGIVRDAETDEPVEGARVQVESWRHDGLSQRNTSTDADGAFQIQLFPGDNRVTISKSGYGIEHDRFYQPHGDLERDYRLWDMPVQDAQVSGRVVDAETGEGVQAYITLRPDWDKQDQQHTSHDGGSDETVMVSRPASPHYNNYNSTVTDEDGRFTMQAYPGHVIVEANRVDYLVSQRSLELTENDSTDATFELEPLPERSVTLSGVVTNAANGSVIAGASVQVQVADAGDYGYANTDENGHWELEVRPGYTLIRVSHWGGDVYYTSMDARAGQAPAADDKAESEQQNESHSVTVAESDAAVYPQQGPGYHPRVHTLVTEADSSHEVDIGLQPEREPTTTIVGYVVDQETNEAIAGANVHLQNHDTGDWGRAVTDNDGSFRFETLEGYHTLSLHTSGYLPVEVNTSVPDSGTHRLDLHAHAGEAVHEGWWHPQGSDSRHGPSPMPEPAYETTSSSDDAGRSEQADGSASMDVAAASGGEGNIRGSGGGLGPYAANAVDGRETPAPALLVLVVIAMAALVYARDRRRG